jgi:carbamoyltransferase
VHGNSVTLPMQPSAQDPGPWESVWDPLFACHIVNAPRQLASGAPHHLKQAFAGARL